MARSWLIGRLMKLKYSLIVACLMAQPAFADGYSSSGNPNSISTLGAGDGQVPIFDSSTSKTKWMNQGDLQRGGVNARPNVVHGTTGFFAWTMPEQGNGYKKVLIKFVNYTNPSTSSINFPSPFTYAPDIVGGSLNAVIDASQITIPIVSSPMTATIVVEGF